MCPVIRRVLVSHARRTAHLSLGLVQPGQAVKLSFLPEAERQGDQAQGEALGLHWEDVDPKAQPVAPTRPILVPAPTRWPT